MRKWLNNPWIVGTLACTALALCVLSLRESMGLASPDMNPGAPGDTVVADAPSEEAIQVAAAQAAALGNIREVFPVGRLIDEEKVEEMPEEATKTEHVTVSAIWCQGSVQLAIVNGRDCTVGDVVGSFRIESISEDGVGISHASGSQLLSVGETATVKAAKTPSPLLASQT